jgi:hypothetical protein
MTKALDKNFAFPTYSGEGLFWYGRSIVRIMK